MNNLALDSNILIYLYNLPHDQKRAISESLVAENPVISSQVVSEFLNVSKRLLRLEKGIMLKKVISAIGQCDIVPVEQKHLVLALTLIGKYDFQLFDSIIVASVLGAGCTVLYSEDMQHGLIVENKPTIINPFL